MQRLIKINNIARKSVLMLVFLLKLIVLKSQISVHLGYSLSSVTPRGFELFSESYNNYHQMELSKKLYSIKPASGINISSNYYFREYGIMTIGINHNAKSSEALYTNGNKRIFNHSLTFGEFELGGGIKLNNLALHSEIGVILGIATIDTYYEFNDKTYNFGVENFLNGKYNSIYKAVTLSIKSGYDFNKNISGFIKITGFHYFKPKPYHDKDKSKYFSTPKSNYISTDYQHFNDIYMHFADIPEQYRMKSDIRGLKIIIGLEYHFKNE